LEAANYHHTQSSCSYKNALPTPHERGGTSNAMVLENMFHSPSRPPQLKYCYSCGDPDNHVSTWYSHEKSINPSDGLTTEHKYYRHTSLSWQS